jgi:hypothetical protein
MLRRFGLVLAFLLCAVASATAERRVALVIGNGDYNHAIKLPNPTSDAGAIARLLNDLGFEVSVGLDLGRDALTEKIAEFAVASRGADVALFFYAGHGFQLGGKNLIVPVDAEIASELHAKIRTIEVDTILHDIMGDAQVKIVLLDACRDNPFAERIRENAPRTRSLSLGAGLAEMSPGAGTLIAFATGPGQVAVDGEGQHSPFTRALLTHMGAPGVEVRHTLTKVRAQVAEDTQKQQVPWENTNLTGFVYLAKSSDGSPSALQSALDTPSATTLFDPRVLELELWNAVKSSSNPEEYRAYLEKYPDGTFSDLARSRAAALSEPKAVRAAPSANDLRVAAADLSTEDALGLDRDAWRDVQRRLTALGFGTRGTDGKPGDGTRRAVASWQKARDYNATGFLNRVQHEALLQEPVPASALAPVAAPITRGGAGASQRGAVDRRRERGNEYMNNRAAGEFIGGVLRGATRGRLPF